VMPRFGCEGARLAQTGLNRIPGNRTVLGPEIRAGTRRFPHDPAVERCKSRPRNFKPFRLSLIDLRPIPKPACAQVLDNTPNTLLDAVPPHAQGDTIGSESADHDVDMGMFGVEMCDRNPFEVGTKVLLHMVHQIAR
jgi:hypothetical protein